MTNQEAIEILKRLQEPEVWEPQITDRAFEALQIAIDAVKRQNPITISVPQNMVYACPVCGTKVDWANHYCHYCGQKLGKRIWDQMKSS